MALSEFRSIELLDIGTLGGESVINDGINNLSRGISGFRIIEMVAPLIELVSDDDDLSLYATLRFTGALLEDATVIAPTRARVYILDNQTSGVFTLTFKTSSGPGVIVPQGTRTLCYSDAVQVYGVSSSAVFPIASETVVGVTRYGTDPETSAGLLRTVAVTPASLQAAISGLQPPPPASTTVVGVTRFATPAEGTSGVLNTVAMTPQTVQAKINAIPLASETVVGLSERATNQESIDGLDTTRYVSPAALQAKINTLPVVPITGTPYSVLRIPASGTGQQASPLVIDAAGNMGLRTTTPEYGLHLTMDAQVNPASILLESFAAQANTANLITRKARGTRAAPAVLVAGDYLQNFMGYGYVRNAANTVTEWTLLTMLRSSLESVDVEGRAAGRLAVLLSAGASAVPTEVVRFTALGNLVLGASTPGTGLTKGLVLPSGTAPTAAHPADAIQTWVADQEGLAGQAALHIRGETGTVTVIGNGVYSQMPFTGAALGGVGAPYALQLSQSGKFFFSNNGTEINAFLLPAASAGVFYTFINNQASPRGTRIIAQVGNTIRLGATVSASGGYLQSQTSGDYLLLLCSSGGQWHAMIPPQGWTVT